MMHQEIVEKRRWISEHRFLHALNYTMLLPGPEAQQLATYIGWLMHGVRGGVIAGVFFILPSLFLLIFLSWVYLRYGDVTAIAGVLYGIKPAVTAIVLFAAYRIGKRALRSHFHRCLALLSFIAIFFFNCPFPLIILIAATLGVIGVRLMPGAFLPSNEKTQLNSSDSDALINDSTPLPASLLLSRSHLIRRLGVGLLLWGGGLLSLVFIFGMQHTFSQLAWFFSKAAMVTFGGAYAVLPYVYQGGVEQFTWLSAHQMIDGLALGETTPGPLIMIVTFIGFLAGWQQTVLGPENLALAGIIGACIATFFTFLPSFLFILIGAPLIETTRNTLGFTAPLSAITAAVVGVIINLACFFALHVFWPAGYTGPIDWLSIGMTLIALLTLFRYQMNFVVLLVLCAMLGLFSTHFA